MDLRGHGSTQTEDDLDLVSHLIHQSATAPPLVLPGAHRILPVVVSHALLQSASTAVFDISSVVRALYAPAAPPAVVVAGHSLGGALAIRLTASQSLPIIGCLCLDLVEGSAVASMEHIRHAVAGRPSHFPSLPSAIEWTLRSSITSNQESARVATPPQLRLATPHTNSSTATPAHPSVPLSVSSSSPSLAPSSSYVWRTDLLSSQAHWLGWFSGLSAMFLSCGCPKLLLLASMDRLDREMAVGQMQGKLQVEVVRDAGHQLHEDQPRQVVRLMLDWMQRQQMSRRAPMMREGGGGAGVVLLTPAGTTSLLPRR